MPKIKQLPAHEAQKIAAGEVVERPANIIKELVENSLDAGASRIIIMVENGGKDLIRITDNGCGMDLSDAQVCFDRHATSKLTRVEDLESINTFGFRGEALASIAAVSQVSLITKEEETVEGTHVLMHGSIIQNTVPIGCPTGTDISVANLFFNIPARKKFLKTVQTEWRAIQQLYNAFCFDYPNIHFSLVSEGKQVNNCPAAESLSTRAIQVWDTISKNHLLELSAEENNPYVISGVISDHQQYRYDKSCIYFFINKRWVKNYSLTTALMKGYANVIPEGRYPTAAINITVPAHEVDINIHPRKEEVKFLHPHKIEQALMHAVKKALEKNLSTQLKQNVSFNPAEHSRTNQFSQKESFNPFNFNAFFAQQATPSYGPANPAINSLVLSTLNNNPFNVEIDRLETEQVAPEITYANDSVIEKQIAVPTDRINSNLETYPLSNFTIIGQYKKTYILIEQEDGLFLVDQHAAHERILYELFAHKLSTIATVQLLFPTTITLSAHDISLIQPYLPMLHDHGIIIEQSGQDQLIVQSLPVHLKEHSIGELVKELIGWIIELKNIDKQELTKTINNKLQAQMACKAAIKAGDILTLEKMTQLLTDLEKTANRFCCPHGRPTSWILSLNEIEKKFRRKL